MCGTKKVPISVSGGTVCIERGRQHLTGVLCITGIQLISEGEKAMVSQ